jgi:hypothetical protein
MRQSSLFLFLFLFFIAPGFAQKGILFTNKTDGKEILIKEGDHVKFSYNGYIGQREVKSGIVVSIEDSIIGIAAPGTTGMFGATTTDTRYVYIKDITGFRKFHRSRPYLMSLSTITVTVGSIYLFYLIHKNTDLSFGEKLGVSIGTGVVTSLLIRAVFPERIKNKVGEEWQVKAVK